MAISREDGGHPLWTRDPCNQPPSGFPNDVLTKYELWIKSLGVSRRNVSRLTRGDDVMSGGMREEEKKEKKKERGKERERERKDKYKRLQRG